MGKYARKYRSNKLREWQAFALLFAISLTTSLLAWLATPGFGI